MTACVARVLAPSGLELARQVGGEGTFVAVDADKVAQWLGGHAARLPLVVGLLAQHVVEEAVFDRVNEHQAESRKAKRRRQREYGERGDDPAPQAMARRAHAAASMRKP